MADMDDAKAEKMKDGPPDIEIFAYDVLRKAPIFDETIDLFIPLYSDTAGYKTALFRFYGRYYLMREDHAERLSYLSVLKYGRHFISYSDIFLHLEYARSVEMNYCSSTNMEPGEMNRREAWHAEAWQMVHKREADESERRIRLRNATIFEELVVARCHPRHYIDWILDIDEQKPLRSMPSCLQ
jgi:hypothetical protein